LSTMQLTTTNVLFLMALFRLTEMGLAKSQCQKDTATHCSLFGKCAASLGEAECATHPLHRTLDHRLCQCKWGYCAVNGKCVEDTSVCIQDTGGTCTVLACDASRGPTLCVRRVAFKHCLCPSGFCARAGKCVPLDHASSNELLLSHVDEAERYSDVAPGSENSKVFAAVSALAAGIAVSLMALKVARSHQTLALVEEPLLAQ